MAKKWVALNILLLLVAVGLSRELHQKYEQFKSKNYQVTIDPITVENQATGKTSSGASADNLMETSFHMDGDYFIISERTLFSDIRGREEEQAPAAPVNVLPLNPRPVLVGTIMIDSQYTASVIDPASTAARSAQLSPETFRVGDIYRGYRVVSIEAEQMVLENGGRREVIPLNRTARRVQAPRPATTNARVVSIGPGGGASSAVTVATASAAVPGRTAAATAAQAAQVAQAAQAAKAAINAAQAAATAARQAQNQGATSSSTNGNAAPPEVVPPAQKVLPTQKAKPAQKAQERRTVPSPFGDIIRPGS